MTALNTEQCMKFEKQYCYETHAVTDSLVSLACQVHLADLEVLLFLGFQEIPVDPMNPCPPFPLVFQEHLGCHESLVYQDTLGHLWHRDIQPPLESLVALWDQVDRLNIPLRSWLLQVPRIRLHHSKTIITQQKYSKLK